MFGKVLQVLVTLIPCIPLSLSQQLEQILSSFKEETYE